MLPIKKIVCPTDFSEPAYQGLKTAVELAEHFGAELIVVNAVSPVPIVPGAAAPTGYHIPTVMTEMQTFAENAMDELVSDKIPDAVRVKSHVVQGKPADEIAKLAKEEKSDLIVIATHGESGWQKFLFGSVTEKVVRLAPCPVLTVRQPEND